MPPTPFLYWQEWLTFTIPLCQWDYLEALFREKRLSKPNQKAFCYFLFSHFSRPYLLKQGQWLEGITMAFLEDRFRFRAEYRAQLKKAGLLHCRGEKEAGVKSGKTIQYRILQDVLKDILEAGIEGGEGVILCEALASRKGKKCKIVDHKGKRLPISPSPRPPEALLSPNIPHNITLPPESLKFLECAAQAFIPFTPNIAAIKAHLDTLRENKSPEGIGLYINDALCFQNIQRAGPLPFQARYTLLHTGRFAAQGGCLQSCSREMKRAAYEGLEDCHNYDLEASQAFICLEQMKKAGSDVQWLEAYLQNSRALRAQYSQEIGFDESVWKDCFYAVVMGAGLPSRLNIPACFGELALKHAFEVAFPDDGEARKRAYQAFRKIIGPFDKALKQWRKKIVEQAEEEGNITNALGIRRAYREFERPKTQIPAHILQGAESRFIHTLTALAPHYGYKPLANEHDGLVTIGAIPEEAVEEAKRQTGMNYLKLGKKPFSR